MLIAMAGLPGTGKSTLAATLADRLGAVILNKDIVRSALFPGPVLDYSPSQDDLCMDAIYRAVALIFMSRPQQVVLLDGRTFSSASQVQTLIDWAKTVSQTLHMIECVCEDLVARKRLEAKTDHPAQNRTFALYGELKRKSEPIECQRLVLDTGRWTVGECVERCLDYLTGSRNQGSASK